MGSTGWPTDTIPAGFVKIKEFDRYVINKSGVVLSSAHRSGRRARWWQVTPKPHGAEGYLCVRLNQNRQRVTKVLSRLLLEVFVGPCPEGMQACHNDGDHLNNHVSNLRWDTPSANVQDRKLHGTYQWGERNPNYKHGKYSRKALTAVGQ